MKRRIIKTSNGGVAVIIPLTKSKKNNETEEQWLERVFTKSMKEGGFVGNEFYDTSSELPSRRFRDAWVYKENSITIDIGKAKKQVLSEVRFYRNKELEKTDKDLMRITEIGTPDEINAMKDYRKKLRDLPVKVNLDIASINSINEIEKKYPKNFNILDFI